MGQKPVTTIQLECSQQRAKSTSEARLSAEGSPPPVTLLNSSLGTWAIGDKSNCNVPRKRYSLSLAQGNVTWRDGLGNTDVEAVVSSSKDEFRTTTVNSNHLAGSGQRVGTNWTYSSSGLKRIQIKRGDRSWSQLARCP